MWDGGHGDEGGRGLGRVWGAGRRGKGCEEGVRSRGRVWVWGEEVWDGRCGEEGQCAWGGGWKGVGVGRRGKGEGEGGRGKGKGVRSRGSRWMWDGRCGEEGVWRHTFRGILQQQQLLLRKISSSV